jgi:hypothetical protein
MTSGRWSIVMSMMRMIALALVLLLAAPAGASAEDGITLDPDSAPGKEYEIPAEAARTDNDGSSSSDARGDNGSSALFGAGVEAASAGTSGPKPATPKGTATAPTATTTAATTAAATATTASAAASSEQIASVGDGGGASATLALLGGAAAILVIGGLGGTLLRHRGGSPEDGAASA